MYFLDLSCWIRFVRSANECEHALARVGVCKCVVSDCVLHFEFAEEIIQRLGSTLEAIQAAYK